jgi:penicillin-binding protein 2
MILDRNLKPLAVNRLGFSIKIAPHLKYKRKKAKLDSAINTIIEHIPSLNADKIRKVYKNRDSIYRHDNVTVVEYLDYNEVMPKLTQLSLNEDIFIEPLNRRFYPQGEVAAHLVGYVSKSSKKDREKNIVSQYTNIIGKSGLEKFYNKELEGELGYIKTEVDAFNKKVRDIERHYPKYNPALITTIDLELQHYIHTLFDGLSGVAIVMDAHNGDIITMGSFPEFNNNLFVNGISFKEWKKIQNNFDHPFTNKATRGNYPPGSVIKMGVALGYLEHGLSKDFSVYCSGSFKLGKRNFRCWKSSGHGKTSVIKAIRESCDDYFYKASLKIGINNISETLNKYGFGSKTGIDQPSEFYGINPNKDWKLLKYNMPWYMGETLVSSIGQGFTLVTPIQIARYTAFLATGKLPTPHLMSSIGDIKYEPKVENIEYDPYHMSLIRKGMYQVCNHSRGTASNHLRKIKKIKIAGKTGTAQVVSIPQSEKKRMKESELEYYKRSHAWLTTYGPYKNPKYVVTVLIEHGGHGGQAAGPIVAKIYNKLIDLGYIK